MSQSHPGSRESFHLEGCPRHSPRTPLALAEPSPEHLAFCERAAILLGPMPPTSRRPCRTSPTRLPLRRRPILQSTEAHAVLARFGARDVVRHLALFPARSGTLHFRCFKELVTLLKENLELRAAAILFHPFRLALAGRAGEGELDRVILLLDEAAALPFAVPVKSARTRILEFCSALD